VSFDYAVLDLFMINLDKYKWIVRAWRYRLKVEKHEINFLIKHLKPGQIAVDIGSHKGAYTYWMSKYVGKNGRVYSFEPQLKLYNKLKKLIEYSNLNNISLYPLAFSSSIGKSTLIIPNGYSSPSASIDRKITSNDSKIEIDTTTLDDFFYKKNKISVNYLKCDVEGHELEVLKSGKKFLSHFRPIISIESEARHCGENKVIKVLNFLTTLDYDGYFHNGQSMLSIDDFSVFDYQLNPDKKIYVNNFIFIPK